LAREIAAIFNLKLKPLEIKEIKAKKKVGLKVKLEDKKSCQRYLAAAVQGVQIVPSPLWLQRLLQACGVRPINNIVDLTNFVTLELGQPSHAFDRRFVAGDQIIVRLAKDGEEFVTLAGESRKLTANDCLICDAERPVALAGVMGGLNSEVKDDSTELIFEMANFTPAMIRRTANRLALRTEAAIRFEKGISPSLAELGMRRLLSLVLELVPTAVVASPIVDKNNYDLTPKTITLDPNWLNKRLGVSLEVKEVTDILTRLEFGVENKSGELIITVPDFRGYKDINIPEDYY
jgi:phenylalanyl-tRNA synthetase beta chain